MPTPTPRLEGPIYFFCVPQGPPNRAYFQHATICIAEGLQALGVPFYSNVNYWRLAPGREEYLFRHDPAVSPDDCPVVVTNNVWDDNRLPQPPGLFKKGRNCTTVYVRGTAGDVADLWTTELAAYDLVLRTDYSRRALYPQNFRAWAFGVSNRILRETETVPAFADRRKAILVNFRHEHPLRHLVRERFLAPIESFLPMDTATSSFDQGSSDPYHRLQWEQTGRRHYPDFYQSLRHSAACACFGGYFAPFDTTRGALPARLARRLANRLGFRTRNLEQPDSWRFWEALAAGCVAIHLDLDKYGIGMPVLPENWKHYIGIDLDRIKDDIARLRDEPGLLERISREGRAWVREHYAPIPTARRFLQTVLERR